MSPALPLAGGSPLAVFVSSVEQLPDWLLHSSRGCNETLPLEAACATETAFLGGLDSLSGPPHTLGMGGWELLQ